MLKLRAAGFSVWPFDDPSWPLVVEIFPRAFFRESVRKQVSAECAAYLRKHHAHMVKDMRSLDRINEDAFDALVSALSMSAHAKEFGELKAAENNIEKKEGRIWVPGGAQSASKPSNRAHQESEPTDRGAGMNLGLAGKVAIVAAASKGLGRAVAHELAMAGADVAICARDATSLEKTAKEIGKAAGREVFWQALDVTDQPRVAQFVEAVEKRSGRVDICVTNAGGPPAKKFLEISLEEWRAAVELTLLSAVYFAREVLPRMQKNRWGRLVTITSVSVKQPIDGLLLSNSIRAAVTGLARTLANEFGADGITVNNVCPGYTLTERLDELAEKLGRDAGVPREKILGNWSAQVPLGRLAQPKEFAALVAFLCSERASYINGTSIAVDGGWVRSLL